MNYRGLNQLLSAAVVSKQFKQRLLDHPSEAIKEGYLDFDFQLTSTEWEYVTSIRADSFEEFAEQIYGWTMHHTTENIPKQGNNIPGLQMEDEYLPHRENYAHSMFNLFTYI